MKADAAIDEGWSQFPLPPHIEEVGRVDVQILADNAVDPPPPCPVAPAALPGITELDNLEAVILLLDKQEALQMQTSGGRAPAVEGKTQTIQDQGPHTSCFGQ